MQGWPQTCYVANDGFELRSLCLPPPVCWPHRCTLPQPVHVAWGIEASAFSVLGKQALYQLRYILRPVFVYLFVVCFSEKGSCYLSEAALKLLGSGGNPASHPAKFGSYSGPNRNV